MEMKQDKQQRERDSSMMETTQFLCNLSTKKKKNKNKKEKKEKMQISMWKIWQVKYRQALKQFLHKERGNKNREQQVKATT